MSVASLREGKEETAKHSRVSGDSQVLLVYGATRKERSEREIRSQNYPKEVRNQKSEKIFNEEDRKERCIELKERKRESERPKQKGGEAKKLTHCWRS